ncbi:hypothetical protein VSX64_14640 [Aurantimonas sp. C2-6-R+9]|uniref:hypothetical protein n=1 Tax=unclassified Aurantimonas TaxID=2638230 RepID=UPI002E181D89|nr:MULTISPECIES: hypothetical protein [unclassified Aurantimonas]MEC5291994.1 hypothetical protein [Aurantimonas sp. C2-3-R2]MEC5382106.1 hypothetical protein [Aurantimonas sp. C2-6-R+9]MEC5413079.1 hypothetical protein [Aurantimonas sp. C2-4-R8]
MAKRSIKKTLSLKRATSLREFGEAQTLEEVLRRLGNAIPDRAQRRVAAGDKVLECRQFQGDPNFVAAHFVAFIPDDQVALVPHANPDLSLLSPPAGNDFLDGELMFLVAGNDVVVCRCGLHENAISTFVDGLADNAQMEADDVQFILSNRVDVDALDLVRREGVQEVRFRGVASQVAINEIEAHRERSLREQLVGKVIETVNALLARDPAVAAEAEDLKVEVFLKFDRRSGTEIGQSQLVEVAEDVISDDDEGFEITTLSGRKIRANDVLLNKPIRLEPFGKSVSYLHVRAEMIEYIRELQEPQG